MNGMATLRGLYAITDEKLTPAGTIISQVDKALRGGARMVQLRDKSSPDELLLPLATKLARLCRSYGAVFLVNDRVELALKAGADGVHLGKDDTDLKEARRILGTGAVIGISCYNEMDRAVDAVMQGADYVAFGSFFPSPTKPHAVKAPLEMISRAKSLLDIPVCAIGGVTPENAQQLVQQGADMVAVVSALWRAKDVEEEARRFSRLFSSL